SVVGSAICKRFQPSHSPEVSPGPCMPHSRCARHAAPGTHTPYAGCPGPWRASPRPPRHRPGRPGPHQGCHAAGGVWPSRTTDPPRFPSRRAVLAPAEPPTRLRGASIEPGCRTLPQLLRRLVKVQAPSSIDREALLKQPPQSPGTITEPDHLGRVPDALAKRFKPQTLLERIDSTQDRHQPALMQSGNDLAGPCAGGAQGGHYAHFNLMPGGFAPGLPSLRAKRDHHPISTQKQGSRLQLGRQWLLGGPVSLGYCLELLVELRHGPPPCRLAPLPHGLRTDRPRALPPQQHRRRRKRHKDGQRTAQILELITGPLIRAHTQGFIQWGHRWGRTSLGAPAHPPPPTERSKQAQYLTLDEAFTT